MSAIPTTRERAIEAAESLIKNGLPRPEIGIVLGSGLGGLVDRLAGASSFAYETIPHFPRTTVAGHSGHLVGGLLAGTRAAMLQGRFHHYEGHDLDAVTFPVRVFQQLGVKRLILTAATGGIGERCAPGTILCVSDHLNLLGRNPLRGPNDDRLGVRFPDMTDVYTPRLRALAREEADRLGLELPEGVYACLPGPCYETPAEIRMLRVLGADVVGMSTVPEAIVARHAGMDVLAFAVVTNWAAGVVGAPLSHAEVLAASLEAGPRLATLLEGIVGRLAGEPATP